MIEITVNTVEEPGYSTLKELIVWELVKAPNAPMVRRLLTANDYLERLRADKKELRQQLK